MIKKINMVSQFVDRADLEQALSVAGTGWYNLKYSFVLVLLLIAATVEFLSYSMILPAAVCDLHLTAAQRGFISSIPYIGILITSYPWGYLVDTRGRKNMVIYSSLAGGFISILSALMPNTYSFVVCKFLTSLCLACPSSIPFMFIAEILPANSRDIILSGMNALQIIGSSLVPLLAWAVIPLEFRIDIGSYELRSWRVLVIIFSLLPIMSAVMMCFGPESPKYLFSRGNYDEALLVLQTMYAGNKNKKPEDYPIQKLIMPPDNREKRKFLASLKMQTIPLLKGEYFKWMILNGFLFFGMFSVLNGLYIWVPDLLNRVLTGDGGGKTACQVIFDGFNQTNISNKACDDTIDEIAFITNAVAQLSCGLIGIFASSTIKIIGKKSLLVGSFLIIGTFCILINVTTNEKMFTVLMSSLALLVLGMGPVNAYTVEIFPTHLRGMAITLSLMLGRLGSIAGSNVAGLLIYDRCETMFYFFGALLLFCAALSLLLPKSTRSHIQHQSVTRL